MLKLVPVIEVVVEPDRLDADPDVEDGRVLPEPVLDTVLDLSYSLVPDTLDD